MLLRDGFLHMKDELVSSGDWGMHWALVPEPWRDVVPSYPRVADRLIGSPQTPWLVIVLEVYTTL